MQVNHIRLINFRNYENIKVDFASNYNIFYGKNAQGKTNIIEAIYLCAAGRSHRTSRDLELVKIGQSRYTIELCLEKERQDIKIEVLFDKDLHKKIKINEIPVKKMGNLMGNLNAVIFSPEDLMIIKEGPSERRKFIDIALSQIKPAYFYDLQQYSKILTQRNYLLKELQKNQSLIETLEIWNENLIKVGTRIIKNRIMFLSDFQKFLEKNHNNLTNEKEKLTIEYKPSFKLENYETIEEDFRKYLQRIKRIEITKGSTLAGPQRDDYIIQLNGMNIKNFGSQGQQRTAVLSLKLTELDIMRENTGSFPILLLDDVMSELDELRQRYLFENLKEIQTFITCTDKRFFKNRVNSKSKFYNIENGKVLEG